MSSFEFGIIDYNEMDRTTIGPSKHKFVAMGVSSEERVYGIATDGILYELDTTTGEETEVGPTGVYVASSSEKSYTQSGAIDQDDDTFYWAAYVTWGKPSGSVHNGYLGELRYDIVRYPDAKTVGTNISGQSFSETIKDKSLCNYYYGIIPVNGTIPAEMAKSDYVMLTFVGEADTYGVVRIDDVCVRSIYDNDLAVSISAPAKMKRGVSGKATVTVTNNGEKDASNYRVMLTADGTLAFDQTVTEVLKPLQTKSFTVDVKSNVTSQSSKLRLVADVEYAADQYKADNTANCMVDLAELGIPSPENFSATNDQAAQAHHELERSGSGKHPESRDIRELRQLDYQPVRRLDYLLFYQEW